MNIWVVDNIWILVIYIEIKYIYMFGWMDCVDINCGVGSC